MSPSAASAGSQPDLGEFERLFGEAPERCRWWPDLAHVVHGPPERSPIFSSISALTVEALGPRTKLWPNGLPADEQIATTEKAVAHALAGGQTAKVEGVQDRVPAIAAALGALAGELATPLRRFWANLYLSSEGVGVGEHVDGHEVIVVQLAGRKRWQIAAGDGSLDVDLAPGSALFVPRLTRHKTLAIGGASVSLSLAFDCYSMGELALQGIGRLLAAEPSWRRAAGRVDGEPDAARVSDFDHMLRRFGSVLAADGTLALERTGERLP